MASLFLYIPLISVVLLLLLLVNKMVSKFKSIMIGSTGHAMHRTTEHLIIHTQVMLWMRTPCAQLKFYKCVATVYVQDFLRELECVYSHIPKSIIYSTYSTDNL